MKTPMTLLATTVLSLGGVSAWAQRTPPAPVDAPAQDVQAKKTPVDLDTGKETKVETKAPAKAEPKIAAKVETKPETKPEAKPETKAEAKPEAKAPAAQTKTAARSVPQKTAPITAPEKALETWMIGEQHKIPAALQAQSECVDKVKKTLNVEGKGPDIVLAEAKSKCLHDPKFVRDLRQKVNVDLYNQAKKKNLSKVAIHFSQCEAKFKTKFPNPQDQLMECLALSESTDYLMIALDLKMPNLQHPAAKSTQTLQARAHVAPPPPPRTRSLAPPPPVVRESYDMEAEAWHEPTECHCPAVHESGAPAPIPAAAVERTRESSYNRGHDYDDDDYDRDHDRGNDRYNHHSSGARRYGGTNPGSILGQLFGNGMNGNGMFGMNNMYGNPMMAQMNVQQMMWQQQMAQQAWQQRMMQQQQMSPLMGGRQLPNAYPAPNSFSGPGVGGFPFGGPQMAASNGFPGSAIRPGFGAPGAFGAPSSVPFMGGQPGLGTPIYNSGMAPGGATYGYNLGFNTTLPNYQNRQLPLMYPAPH